MEWNKMHFENVSHTQQASASNLTYLIYQSRLMQNGWREAAESTLTLESCVLHHILHPCSVPISPNVSHIRP